MARVTIFPLAWRSGAIAKIADRLERFDRESPPGAAEKWWSQQINGFQKKAQAWGATDYEIERQLRGLHNAVRVELHRRAHEARKQNDRK